MLRASQRFLYLITIFIVSPFPPNLHAKRFLSDLPPGINPTRYVRKEEDPPKYIPPPPQLPHSHPNENDEPFPPVPNVLDAQRIEEERTHIQEHLDVPVDTSKMSEKELQFHYFRMADADKNSKLDGQEMIYFIIHRQHETAAANNGSAQPNHEDGDHSHEPSSSGQIRIFTDNELSEAIDPILERTDKNNDGMVDWQEFITSIEEDSD